MGVIARRWPSIGVGAAFVWLGGLENPLAVWVAVTFIGLLASRVATAGVGE